MKTTKKKKVNKSGSENVSGIFDKGVDYSQAHKKFSEEIIRLINHNYLNVHELKRFLV